MRLTYKSRFDPRELVKLYPSDSKSYVKRGKCIEIYMIIEIFEKNTTLSMTYYVLM